MILMSCCWHGLVLKSYVPNFFIIYYSILVRFSLSGQCVGLHVSGSVNYVLCFGLVHI